MPSKTTFPKYTPGKRAGYDEKSRRYRDRSGAVVPRKKFLREYMGNKPVVPAAGAEQFGSYTAKSPFAIQSSKAFESIESLVSGLEEDVARIDLGKGEDRNLMSAAEKLEKVLAYRVPREQPEPQPIPSSVLAMMRLSEFYCNTEGDVWQHIASPIDIAINTLDIQCPDDGVKKELRQLYDDLDMENVLAQLYQCVAQFGSAYPLIVPSDDSIAKVIVLPPKYVWVGYMMGWSTNYATTNKAGQVVKPPYAFLPQYMNEDKWTTDLVNSTFMPMSYNAFGPGMNEQIEQGWGIPLDPKWLRPVRAKSLEYVRYPYPDIGRSFRAISTRYVFEEVARATIEGYKNQLWVFALEPSAGNPTVNPAEGRRLNAIVSGEAGKRTGHMVWYGSKLTVEQHTPKPLEQMYGNELWQHLTLRIYRGLGGNARLTTGNGFMGERGDQGIAIDLSIWLKRMEHAREGLLVWEKYLRKLLTEKKKGDEKWAAAMEKTTVVFSRSLLENSELIKAELLPLYMAGLVDRRTTQKKAGYNYDEVTANKKLEKKDDLLYEPQASFAQTTVKPGTPEKKAASSSTGRPADSVNKNKIKAAIEDDNLRRQLFAEIYAAYMLLLESGEVGTFIEAMRQNLDTYLPQMAQTAFTAVGGLGDVPGEWETVAANFVTSFLDNLKADLISAPDLSKFERRVLMYPNEGTRMAFAHGVQAAMEMRGATYWKRILHPESSQTGPCPHCIADSLIAHPISEPFTNLHVGCVCEHQELYVQFFSGGIPSVEIPLPGQTESEWADTLVSLGKMGKPIIRRKRSE